MKIKVPKEIQIGCHTYKICQAGDTELFGERGLVSHREEEITVNKANSPTTQNVNLIHESLHIIDRVWETDLTEIRLSALAEGLGQLLFSNLGIELDWSEIPTKTAVVKEKE